MCTVFVKEKDFYLKFYFQSRLHVPFFCFCFFFLACLTESPSFVVCYTAVFSVVTQHSSPLTAAENRTTFLSRD